MNLVICDQTPEILAQAEEEMRLGNADSAKQLIQFINKASAHSPVANAVPAGWVLYREPKSDRFLFDERDQAGKKTGNSSFFFWPKSQLVYVCNTFTANDIEDLGGMEKSLEYLLQVEAESVARAVKSSLSN